MIKEDVPSYAFGSIFKALIPELPNILDIHHIDGMNSQASCHCFAITQLDIREVLNGSKFDDFRYQAWTSLDEMLTKAMLDKASVIIYPLMSTELEGVENLLNALANYHSPATLIIMGNSLPGSIVASLLKRGVVDYINTSMEWGRQKQHLREAILRAKDVSIERAKLSRLNEMYDQLTAKEKQVAEQLMLGHINKVIADKLDISVRTVEVRRAQIMKKMQSPHSVNLVQKLLLVNLWQTYRRA